MSANETPGGVWKWVAAILVTILLTGSPSVLYALRTWGLRDDVHEIRERQDDVRLRLTAVEVQAQLMLAEIDRLREELANHERRQ
jgi:hypothetical protein